MDMVSIIIRRLRTGRSPFKPDRDHIHHVLQNLGYNSISVLLIICGMASILASLGVVAEIYDVAEKTMFLSFILMFVIYHQTISNFSKKHQQKYRDEIN
jgi:UDP-GlcNAc:undecaprenyl-phosphate GlcNAc-1-phosphate transferase